MANKPILLLDVDGVINALADSRTILGRGLVAHDAIGPDGRTYRLHLEPETPRRLATLAEHLSLRGAQHGDAARTGRSRHSSACRPTSTRSGSRRSGSTSR